jgi:hypothetical protein
VNAWKAKSIWARSLTRLTFDRPNRCDPAPSHILGVISGVRHRINRHLPYPLLQSNREPPWGATSPPCLAGGPDVTELIDPRTRMWALLAAVVGVVLFVGLEILEEPDISTRD